MRRRIHTHRDMQPQSVQTSILIPVGLGMLRWRFRNSDSSHKSFFLPALTSACQVRVLGCDLNCSALNPCPMMMMGQNPEIICWGFSIVTSWLESPAGHSRHFDVRRLFQNPTTPGKGVSAEENLELHPQILSCLLLHLSTGGVLILRSLRACVRCFLGDTECAIQPRSTMCSS